MKRNRPKKLGFSICLLAAALATASGAHADFAIAKRTTPIAANGIGAHKGAIPANGVRKQKRKAFIPACTAPSKSPFPCQPQR